MALDVVVPIPFNIGNYGQINNTILNGISDPTPSAGIGFVAGDEVLLSLYPRTKSSPTAASTTSAQLDSGFAIRVVGKVLGNPGASTVLWDATSFTQVQTGSDWHYDGALNLNTAELFAALGTSQTLQAMLIIQITDASGAVQTFLSPVTIYAPYYTSTEGTPVNATGMARGSLLLGAGVNSGTVTGLGLANAPSQVLVSMRKVTGGLNLFAIVRDDTITTDGFSFDLSSATDAATYKLDYLVMP